MRLGIGAAHDEAPVGAVRQRGPHLLTGDHPLVAVEHRTGLDVREVGTGVRLGEALAPQLLDRLDLREEPPLLLVGAELDQRGGEQPLTEERDPRRRVRARVLLVEDHLLRERRARGRRTPRATTCRPSGRRRAPAPTRSARPSRSRRPARRPSRARRTRRSDARPATRGTSARKAASSGVSRKSMAARTLLDRPVRFPCRWLAGRRTIGVRARSTPDLRRSGARTRSSCSPPARARPRRARRGLRRVVPAGAVRQPREADPPRERFRGADPQRSARGVLRVVAAGRHRRHLLAELGRAARAARSSSASTPGAARPRCTTTSADRSTPTEP